MAKVSRRGGFSDRNKIKSENTEIQLTAFDIRTRTQFQNMLTTLYDKVYEHDLYDKREHIQNFLKYVLDNVYAEPIDCRKYYDDDVVVKMINSTLRNDDYDDVLTIIEAIVQYWDQYLKDTKGYSYYNEYVGKYCSASIYEYVNNVFKREYVGYRFVDGIIVPISDEYELNTVDECMNSVHQPVYDHISKANRLLANRESPDYENSIKESISAVEALCEIVTGMKGKDATLGNMLKKLEDNGIEIHKGLKSAFNILYGYTSDANGIRHAGDIGGPASTFEEAKFMLVSCCAFVNYLTAIYAD